MKATITTEQEGNFEQVRLKDLHDYLHNIAEISNNSIDFCQKVSYGLSDESRSQINRLSKNGIIEFIYNFEN